MKKIPSLLKCVFIIAFSIFWINAAFSSELPSKLEIKNAQIQLNKLGFDAGKPDGVYGQKTKSALIEFFLSIGSSFDGEFSQNEINVLAASVDKNSPESGKFAISREVSLTDMRTLNNKQKKVFSFYPHEYANLELKYHIALFHNASFDFDGDGHQEIFGAIHVIDENDDYHTDLLAKPFVLSWTPDLKKLEINREWESIFPEMSFPRRFEFFSSPLGKNLLVADYGVDGYHSSRPNCGGQNRWFIHDGDKILDNSKNLPSVYDMTHDLKVSDINDDGFPDILVVNDWWHPTLEALDCSNKIITEDSYLLLSSGESSFKKYTFKRLGIEPSILYLSGAILKSKDEFSIILGRDGDNKRNKAGVDIYEFRLTEGKPVLTNTNEFELPGNSVGAEIVVTDFQNDGVSEIIISNAIDNSWKGNQLSVLEKTPKWELSYLFFPYDYQKIIDKKDRGWCQKIFTYDLDGNGMLDYLCSNRSDRKVHRPRIVLNFGSTFSAVSMSSSENNNKEPIPVKTQNAFSIITNGEGKRSEYDTAIEWKYFLNKLK